MTLIYQQDSFTLDAERITDETHPVFGDMTVFHDVVIASEIVQQYNDGFALKSRDELEAYAWTVNDRWIIAGAHPTDGIISERDQVAGRTTNAKFVKDLKDPKTQRKTRAGVRADVQVFNDKIQPALLKDMKSGLKADVSIGFFFSKDDTSGVVTDGILKGEEFDYKQTNMFHDHLAVGIDNGRCPSPLCGLGADEIGKRVTGDPFAGFASFAECEAEIRSKNPEMSEESVAKICGSLKAKHEDSKAEDDLMVKSAAILRTLLQEELESLRGERDALKETTEWYMTVPWKEEPFITIFDTLNDETRQLIIDAELCPSCGDREGKCPEGEEWNEEHNGCVPIKDAEEDVLESNPGFTKPAPAAEAECPEGKEWNAEKGQCVEIANFSDRPENKLVPDEVFERYKTLSSTQ